MFFLSIFRSLSLSFSLILSGGQGTWDPALLPLIAQLGPQTPFEVQINGADTNGPGGKGGNMTGGMWLPASLQVWCVVAIIVVVAEVVRSSRKTSCKLIPFPLPSSSFLRVNVTPPPRIR